MRGTITTQDLFDKVVEHSKKMTKQAWSPEMESCAYRTKDGNRCFIGSLITDEVYAKFWSGTVPLGHADAVFSENSLEGKTAVHCLVVDAVEESLNVTLTETQRDLMQNLQPIHDGDFGVRDWYLKHTAARFKLQYKE